MMKLTDLDPDFVRTVLNTTPEFLAGMESERETREARAPRLGDLAPDFSLPRLDAAGTVRLSEFRGRQPVVLIFGSYT